MGHHLKTAGKWAVEMYTVYIKLYLTCRSCAQTLYTANISHTTRPPVIHANRQTGHAEDGPKFILLADQE